MKECSLEKNMGIEPFTILFDPPMGLFVSNFLPPYGLLG